MRALILLVAILAYATPAIARSGVHVYVNRNFHYSVAVPAGIKLCDTSSGDGFTISLEGKACGALYAGNPIIRVTADFETSYDVPSSKALAEDVCSDDWDWYEASPPKPEPAPPDLAFPGHPTFFCRDASLEVGEVEIFVVTLLKYTKNWNMDKDLAASFSVELETTPARLAQDMVVFKSIVHGVRFRYAY